MHVVVEGQGISVGAPRHAKTLAALLLRANSVVPTDVLVETVWDDEGPATAVRQVQDSISSLRRNFAQHGLPADLITTHWGGYCIRLEASQLDLLEFDRLRAAAPCEALKVWRGPALLGLRGRVLQNVGARLNALRTSVHVQCLRQDLAHGRHHEIVNELLMLGLEQPYDEHVAEMTMLALRSCGRRSEALEVYRVSYRALAELGLGPGAALRAVHQRILTEQPETWQPAPSMQAPTAPR